MIGQTYSQRHQIFKNGCRQTLESLAQGKFFICSQNGKSESQRGVSRERFRGEHIHGMHCRKTQGAAYSSCGHGERMHARARTHTHTHTHTHTRTHAHTHTHTQTHAHTHVFPHLQMTSLVAQSLDLPPSAARWRHHQRALDSSSGVCVCVRVCVRVCECV